MLGPIKNRKEIAKSFNNYQNLMMKEKNNNLNKTNILNNQFGKRAIINSTLFNSRINLKDNNKNKIFLSELQNKDNSTKYIKKNKLVPINKKYLHKANSVKNIFQNHNQLDIINTRQLLNNSKKTLQKIKQQFNNSSYNNNFNNMTGFKTTKNNNTNYTVSKNNSQIYLSSYNKNFAKTRISKNNQNFSKFFYKSQSKFITSKKIFRHYIREEERDKVVPIKFFKKGGAPKSIKELKFYV